MQTSIKQTDTPIDQMMMNAPIRASDVANMFRTKVDRNERPLQKTVQLRNNDLVDRWYKEVLFHLADKEMNIPVLRVNKCFEYFFEGLETTQIQRFKDHMPVHTEENIRFWIDFFKNNDMDAIHEAGIAVVSAGWSVVTGGLRTHFAQKRWEVVYSQTTNPLEWDKLANNNPNLMHSRPLPFDLTEEDLKDMEQKIQALLGNPIQPRTN
jgi:hypothetical protein